MCVFPFIFPKKNLLIKNEHVNDLEFSKHWKDATPGKKHF